MEIFIEGDCYNEESLINASGLLLLYENDVKLTTGANHNYYPDDTKINLGYGFFYLEEEDYITIYKNHKYYTLNFPLEKSIKTNPNFIKTIKQNPKIYKGEFDIINIPDNTEFKYLFGVNSNIDYSFFNKDVPDIIVTEKMEIIQSKKLKFDLYKELL